MSLNNNKTQLPEALYPEIYKGSELIVWCLEFPPEQVGSHLRTRLIESVRIEVVEIPADINQPVRALDQLGRSFLTKIETRHSEPNRVFPNFFVPDSIRLEGGSPEWVTPDLAKHYGWEIVNS